MNNVWFKRLGALISAGLLTFAASGVCLAEDGNSGSGYDQLGKTDSWDVFWMMVQVVGFLVVIIGIFLIIIKIVAQKNRGFLSGRSIKPLGGLTLGQHKSVQIVQVGHSLFVLGVGNDVHLIAKIDNPEEVQHIQDNLYSGGTNQFPDFPTFGEWLKGLWKKREIEEEMDVSASFQAVFQEKIQRLTNRNKQVEEWIDQQNKSDRLDDNS